MPACLAAGAPPRPLHAHSVHSVKIAHLAERVQRERPLQVLGQVAGGLIRAVESLEGRCGGSGETYLRGRAFPSTPGTMGSYDARAPLRPVLSSFANASATSRTLPSSPPFMLC